MNRVRLIVLAPFLLLAACVEPYTLVSPSSVAVSGGTMHVQPGMAWNKAPKSPFVIAQEEDWTENGPLLDQLIFIGGVADGKAIAKQPPKADQRVPLFHATMSPQDLVSMIESYYRIQTGAKLFETKGVQPTQLGGHPGLRFDYVFIGADDVKRRGRSVAAIVDGKFYMIALHGTASHYFDAAAPDFDTVIASATIR